MSSIFGKHSILTGLDVEDIRKDGIRTGKMEMMDMTSTSRKSLWNDSRIQNIGLFSEYTTSISSMQLNLSLRGDYNQATSGDTLVLIKDNVHYFDDTQSQFLNFSMNMAISKMVSPWLDITIGLGRGTRSPNMLERYIKLLPVGYDRFDYLGNPQLKPETNNELDISFQFVKPGLGNAHLNFFYSYVENFINGKLLPTSVITPQSQGVLGVRQFENINYITSKGFEFGYASPDLYRVGGKLIASFTHAEIPRVTKYIIEDGEVVGKTNIKNDPLPEIPPFESTASIYFKFLDGALVPELSMRMVADQHHVSEAFYENETPGFTVFRISSSYQINDFLFLNAGISNIFNNAYYEHLNRRIIGSTDNLLEPGRTFYATLHVNL